MRKLFLIVCGLSIHIYIVYAQSSTISISNTNSPYSRYGIGLLSDEGNHASRAMGGIGYALRSGRQLNSLNPASYSAADSLTFLFEAGITGKISSFKENGKTQKANNSEFDYAQLGFRLRQGLGLSVGLRPYSVIGYNMGEETEVVDTETDATTPAKYNYYGTGGVRQVFAGVGYEVIPQKLSLGLSASYLFGTLNKSIAVTGDPYRSAVTKQGISNIYDYKVEVGAQYTHLLNVAKEQRLTIGATFSPAHTSDIEHTTSTGGQKAEFTSPFKWGATAGLGVAYTDPNFIIGLDYNLQQWKQTYYEALNNAAAGNSSAAMQQLVDRHRIAAGMEWLPALYSNSFLRQLRYRAGVHYTTPYSKLRSSDGTWQDGYSEWGVSAGVGIPLRTLNRSIINLTFGYLHTSAPSMLTDNTFRVSLGITFNETWFRKWRVE